MKKGLAECEPFVFVEQYARSSLALGELERTASFCFTVLLTFNNTAVAGQEACCLQSATQGHD